MGFAFWVILDEIKVLKPLQRNLFANKVHIYVYLADSKTLGSYQIEATGNPIISQLEESSRKKQVTMTKHLVWDTLDINWSSGILKLGIEATLPTLVTYL